MSLQAPHSIEAMALAGCTTPRGIRLWEDTDLLGTVSRTPGGTRRYTDEQLDKARIIAAARFGGWSLDDIRGMLAEWGEEAYTAIMTRLADQTRAAVRLGDALPRPPAEPEALQANGSQSVVAEYDL